MCIRKWKGVRKAPYVSFRVGPGQAPKMKRIEGETVSKGEKVQNNSGWRRRVSIPVPLAC